MKTYQDCIPWLQWRHFLLRVANKMDVNPLFADKLAKFADEILLHGQEHLIMKNNSVLGGGGGGVTPNCSHGPEKKKFVAGKLLV